jgi:hypothetical protein
LHILDLFRRGVIDRPAAVLLFRLYRYTFEQAVSRVVDYYEVRSEAARELYTEQILDEFCNASLDESKQEKLFSTAYSVHTSYHELNRESIDRSVLVPVEVIDLFHFSATNLFYNTSLVFSAYMTRTRQLCCGLPRQDSLCEVNTALAKRLDAALREIKTVLNYYFNNALSELGVEENTIEQNTMEQCTFDTTNTFVRKVRLNNEFNSESPARSDTVNSDTVNSDTVNSDTVNNDTITKL